MARNDEGRHARRAIDQEHGRASKPRGGVPRNTVIVERVYEPDLKRQTAALLLLLQQPRGRVGTGAEEA